MAEQKLEIFVCIRGDHPASDHMFSVKASPYDSVSTWREEVHTKKRSFEMFYAADLTLWKLRTPIPSASLDAVVDALDPDLSGVADKMLPVKKLSYYFSTPPTEECLHVIVELPSRGLKRKARAEPDGTDEPPRKRGPRHSGPKSVVTNSEWCDREVTVGVILELLHKRHLVQVRGTPASGKTTLMCLLHARIVKERPNAQIFIQKDWPKNIVGLQDNTERLVAALPGYPSFPDGERYFLFDEGQSTYWDTTLWVAFKDSIQSTNKPVYAILFCSYGNEGVSDPQSPTPLDFGDARVTLNRTDKGLSKLCGLLLDEDEFRDVLIRRPKLRLADDLRDFVYSFTRGHVGAVIAVVEFLLKKRESSMLKGVPYSLVDFHQDTTSYDEFCNHLSMDRGIGRGMPEDPALFAQAMRALLLHGSIHTKDKGVSEDTHLNLKEGYKYGFINLDEANLYTFASPLHRQLWSWYLLPQTDYQLLFQDLLSFVKATVSHFRPSQLDVSDRRVRSPSHRPPEAQYQDECYRCVHILTHGNVRISPEYAAAAGSRPGRIDFFIPSKKWGIEVTREGSKLEEHNARFADNGAYGQWLKSLDMDDYVLLDFRSTMPRDPHKGIKNLYHVVFSEDKTQLEIYNNQLSLQDSRNLMQQR